MNDLGFVIYPGKVSRADCFRVGTIGCISPEDVRDLLKAVEQTLAVIFSSGRETPGGKRRMVLQQDTGR
jgi:aspartate aminotransferase-like enzyme